MCEREVVLVCDKHGPRYRYAGAGFVEDETGLIYVCSACRAEKFELERKAEKKRLREEKKKAYKKQQAESLSDNYVKQRLRYDNKFKNEDISQELIDIKRVVMTINRAKRKGCGLKIFMVCRKHGQLTSKMVNKRTDNGREGYRCKQCLHNLQKRHWQQNKEKVKLKQAARKAANPEMVKEIKRKSAIKHAEKRNEYNRITRIRDKAENPEKCRREENIRKQRSRDTLSDGYIRKLIKKKTKGAMPEISSEVIELKRKQVMIARMNKQRKYGNDKIPKI